MNFKAFLTTLTLSGLLTHALPQPPASTKELVSRDADLLTDTSTSSLTTSISTSELVTDTDTSTSTSTIPTFSEINESELAARKFGPPLSDPSSSRDQNASTLALGSALISNHCTFPLYLWSVDFNRPSPPMTVIPPRATHYEAFRIPSNKGGISLKVAKEPRLGGDNIVQFEYTVAGEKFWYDLSFVNCARNGREATPWCPGHAYGLMVRCTDGGCARVECKPGQYCPYQAYYTPTGPDGPFEPTFASEKWRSIEYVVCSSNN